MRGRLYWRVEVLLASGRRTHFAMVEDSDTLEHPKPSKEAISRMQKALGRGRFVTGATPLEEVPEVGGVVDFTAPGRRRGVSVAISDERRSEMSLACVLARARRKRALAGSAPGFRMAQKEKKDA